MSDFYKNGLRFSCTQCGYCCGVEPGFVFLSEKDLQALSGFFSMSRDDFIETYCRKVNFGSYNLVSLKEKSNNDCIFVTEKGCQVYENRPLQCRSYPFWTAVVEEEQYWLEEGHVCPGIGKGTLHTADEINEWLRARRAEQPIHI